LRDIFYFSPKELVLRDIYDLLNRTNLYTLLLTENSDALQVALGDTVIWQMYQMDILSDFSEEDNRNIRATNARTCFCISFHSNTLNELKVILRALLTAFDGWVGDDTDGFEPRFELKNIDQLGSTD
jgi:hypothetical protein